MATAAATPSAPDRVLELRPRYPGELIGLARRDPLGLFLRMSAAGGALVRARIGTREVYLLRHPGLIRALLSYAGDDLVKERALRLSRIFLGKGLVTSDGALHRRQRRLLLPGFHQGRVEASAEVMVELARRRAERWRDGEVVAVDEEMMNLTLEIAAKALFGAELDGELDTLRHAVAAAIAVFDRHRNPFAALLNRLPLPATVRAWRAKRRLGHIVRGLVSQRRQSDTAPDDLLTLLLTARDAGTDTALSDEQVRDEIFTLLLAGHETTACALTWSWYFLGRHPAVEARLHAEVDAVLGERAASYADVPRLTYTRQVLSEAMRLRPPVWAVSRQAAVPLEIAGHRFTRGATLVVCQYALHRDPAWWVEPEAFRPERFATGVESGVHRFTYLPFSAGPRGCIGEHFAWTECVLVLATLARRWRLRPAEGAQVGLRPSITLRPDRPVLMRAEAR